MCPPKFFEHMAGQATSRRDFFKFGLGAAAATATALTATQVRPTFAQSVSFNNVADLTHIFGTNTPLYPGSPEPSINIHVTIEANGFYGNILQYWEHTGTHMDAPAHFAVGGIYVDQIAPSALVVPIAVIDISARAAVDPDTVVTLDDILAYEQQYGTIPENAGVFMNSGWASRFNSIPAFVNLDGDGIQHYPGFSREATDFLEAQRNIAGIGVGALFHGYVPEQWVSDYLAGGDWYTVPLAVLVGIPLYSNATGVIPVAEAMLGKGVALGTTLAFMMSIAALSLPEMIILRKVIRWPGLALYAGVLAIAFILVGYGFNLLA
ncbi:MAG: cyclase family protein [Rhodospirillales bacterium]|nr:cyclase family protein [Rhodospirillales bacterium]